MNAKPGAQQARRHRRAHDAQADDPNSFGFHRLFLDFFFLREEILFLKVKDLALTSTKQTMQGSLPRTLHEWLVPLCTRMSPARSSFSPFSITAWISPSRTMA